MLVRLGQTAQVFHLLEINLHVVLVGHSVQLKHSMIDIVLQHKKQLFSQSLMFLVAVNSLVEMDVMEVILKWLGVTSKDMELSLTAAIHTHSLLVLTTLFHQTIHHAHQVTIVHQNVTKLVLMEVISLQIKLKLVALMELLENKILWLNSLKVQLLLLTLFMKTFWHTKVEFTNMLAEVNLVDMQLRSLDMVQTMESNTGLLETVGILLGVMVVMGVELFVEEELFLEN
eukprot:GILJ01036127.1.p2 GENE.GILJ01036127.1~~GILJ01036127.1.p2  ORF type:complete len:229 (+),score=29.01 GILJ01036127.1:329-1015(+)